MPRRIPFEDQYIPEPNSGCWIWIGAINPNGYGKLYDDGEYIGAHRKAWKDKYGDPESLHVLHKCDVKCCVNPEHLFLGTPQDNMDDMHKKGRWKPRSGEDSHFSKLKEEDVKSIRGDIRPNKEIAKDYEISSSSVCMIKNKTTWRHV